MSGTTEPKETEVEGYSSGATLILESKNQTAEQKQKFTAEVDRLANNIKDMPGRDRVAAVHQAGDLLAAEDAMLGDFGLAIGDLFDERGAALAGDQMPAGDAFGREALGFGGGEAIGKGGYFFGGELEEHVSPL